MAEVMVKSRWKRTFSMRPRAALTWRGSPRRAGAEVVDFSAGDDGDEAGAVHFLEGPAEGGGELGARDLDHAEIGDVVDDSAGVGVEVVDFEGHGELGGGGELGHLGVG